MAGKEGISLTGKPVYDSDLYGGGQTPYLAKEIDDEEPEEPELMWVLSTFSTHACMHACDSPCIHRPGRNEPMRGLRGEDLPDPTDDSDQAGAGQKSIYEREDEYRRRRLNRIISPDRNDAFAMGDKTPDSRVRTYADIMREQQIQREMENTMRNIVEKKKQEAEQAAAQGAGAPAAKAPAPAPVTGEKRRNRWDQSTE